MTKNQKTQNIREYLIEEKCTCGQVFKNKHSVFDHIYNMSDSFGDRNHRYDKQIITDLTEKAELADLAKNLNKTIQQEKQKEKIPIPKRMDA